MTHNFYSGCAVWSYKDWVGEFFPPGSKSSEFLRLYSRRLTTVEGNSTFYAIPKAETVARWAAETPAGFRFCPKLPRDISHHGALVEQMAATTDFVKRMALLGDRLGPFFLQLPPGYSPAQRGDLARWLATWPAEYELAVEVRHPDWYRPPNETILMDMLEQRAVGRVLMDVRPIRSADHPLPAAVLAAQERKPDVPLHPLRSGSFSMIRYIGHPDAGRNAALLDEWAGRVAGWLAEGDTVYWFSHCPDERYSPQICREFQRRLEQQAPIPPLPWNTIGGIAKQQRLL
jgi:uncharacterized protein YecE (DUF72 family)